MLASRCGKAIIKMWICFLHPFIITNFHLKPFSGFFSSTKSLSPRSLAYHMTASKVPLQHHKYTILWLHNMNSRLNHSNLFALPPHVLSCINTILYLSLMPQYSCVRSHGILSAENILILFYLASSFSFISIFSLYSSLSMCHLFLSRVFPNSKIELYVPLLCFYNNSVFICLTTYTPDG